MPQDNALSSIAPLPAEALAEDARPRLLRYLSDAYSGAREQSDLLAELAEANTDPDARELFREGQVEKQRQTHNLRERLRSLGAELSGGRGLLDRLAIHVWKSIRARDERDRALRGRLDALGAAELQAGLVLAVHALAGAVGEAASGELAAA